MTKIFIATPAFDGKVNAQYSVALAETNVIFARMGIPCQILIHCSGSLLCAERNRLVKEFLKTDCSHMLCIDSDLGWQPNVLPGLLLRDKDIIAGIYPTRRDNMFIYRPSNNEDGSIVSDGNGLLKMEHIPVGFMLIKRCVLEKLVSDNPQLYFSPKKINKDSKEEILTSDGYCLFNTELYEGEFWGEDYVFSRLVRNSGFDIWVDPLLEFDHSGVKASLIMALTNDKNKAQV